MFTDIFPMVRSETPISIDMYQKWVNHIEHKNHQKPFSESYQIWTGRLNNYILYRIINQYYFRRLCSL